MPGIPGGPDVTTAPKGQGEDLLSQASLPVSREFGTGQQAVLRLWSWPSWPGHGPETGHGSCSHPQGAAVRLPGAL